MLEVRASSRLLGVSYHSRRRLGTWYSSPRCLRDAPELHRESEVAARGSWSDEGGGGGGEEGGGGRLAAEPNSSPPSRLPEVEDRLPEWDRWLPADIPIPLSRELCRPLSWRPRRCGWAEEEAEEEEGDGRPPQPPREAAQSLPSSEPLRAFSVDELDAVSLERCGGLADGSAQNRNRPP